MPSSGCQKCALRSEEHTSELQSHDNVVCRLLLEKTEVQALAALLLISNTIQVAAFNRGNETNIMRLVGASRWYTQLPFFFLTDRAAPDVCLLSLRGLVPT